LAQRDNSVPRSNSSAFEADRTSDGIQDRLVLSRMTRGGHLPHLTTLTLQPLFQIHYRGPKRLKEPFRSR
jgi:hypothetical protein